MVQQDDADPDVLKTQAGVQYGWLPTPLLRYRIPNHQLLDARFIFPGRNRSKQITHFIT